ncbi:MAG TPA: phosphoribosylaminoimidazolesuccinocarboxamide synthase [Syntrophaceae bacterium]|nr:phosphoribosylaminoimidazolesuccinocarboxamide synthase [Syntrophaceae bacterium]
MQDKPLMETSFSDLKLVNRGKVRDIYDLGEHLLIVATDRISAFDVVMPNPIPDKGRILTQLSKFWFRQMESIVAHHLVSTEVDDYPKSCHKYRQYLEERSMLVRKAKPLPVECIVRGYLSGSGWQDYKREGKICGIRLPKGMVESAKLDQPIFTPSTKAEKGIHDENIDYETFQKIVGEKLAAHICNISLMIYRKALDIADNNGIIIADTKLEFGLCDGQLLLIDELLTPDSSRFWPKDHYKPGGPQKSFDKQFLRDYLISIDWNRKPPAPEIPQEIINKTRDRYLEALKRLVS